MNRKICVVTGSRADYGLLRWVMQGIKEDSELTLQVLVTGMHLSPQYGLTYKEIESDGFMINHKLETVINDDTPPGIVDSISSTIVGCARAFEDLKPDIIVLLGDRFEIFAAATAALVARIPVAHLHGGEITSGAYDEALRHSITKMSQMHFVATENYRDRVIQLGESPVHVHLVGGLGIDNIKKLPLMSKGELEASLNLKFNDKSILVTFHPVTLEEDAGEQQLKELLNALAELKDTLIILTMPNADTSNLKFIKLIENFVSENTNAHVYFSLGNLRYLSCIANVDAVIGNSSSGITEAPSFKKGTINIGNRQHGRAQATSVINCLPNKEDIMVAIRTVYSDDFQGVLSKTVNPYGNGGASAKIVEILSSVSLDKIIKKSFHDL